MCQVARLEFLQQRFGCCYGVFWLVVVSQLIAEDDCRPQGHAGYQTETRIAECLVALSIAVVVIVVVIVDEVVAVGV